MSTLGICPYAVSSSSAGLPPGPVRYSLTPAATPEECYRDFWHEVSSIEKAPDSDISTTLMITPDFEVSSAERFEAFASTLTDSLTTLRMEPFMQLVFFHPLYAFRDGDSRLDDGDGAAANFARRSPWPMVNVLRTEQVRRGQRGIPTGLVYKQNARTLGGLGEGELRRMVVERDWGGVEDVKVDRMDHDVLRKVEKKDDIHVGDMRTLMDSDMVKVIREGLEKRVRTGKPLSQTEAAVTLTAINLVLGEARKKE